MTYKEARRAIERYEEALELSNKTFKEYRRSIKEYQRKERLKKMLLIFSLTCALIGATTAGVLMVNANGRETNEEKIFPTQIPRAVSNVTWEGTCVPPVEYLVTIAPVETETVYAQSYSEQTYSSGGSSYSYSYGTMSDEEAKEWIAQRESGGDYNAVSSNGKWYGRYQLTDSYLDGDYSPEHQEEVADAYVEERYGSWSEAQAFWEQNGWY